MASALFKNSQHIIAYLVPKAIRLIVKTCTIHVEGVDILKTSIRNNRTILALWHNRLPLMPLILKKYTSDINYAAVISKSRDGKFLTNIIDRSFPNIDTILVPHNARHLALKEMIGALNNGKVALITPDGPRGPRYEVKPGVIFGAKKSGATIVPLSWSADRFWELDTWDKMIIPKPFSAITVRFCTPLTVEESIDLNSAADLLKTALSQ